MWGKFHCLIHYLTFQRIADIRPLVVIGTHDTVFHKTIPAKNKNGEHNLIFLELISESNNFGKYAVSTNCSVKENKNYISSL